MRAVPDEFIDAGDAIVVLGKYSGAYKATGKVSKQTSRTFGKFAREKPFVLYSTWTH